MRRVTLFAGAHAAQGRASVTQPAAAPSGPLGAPTGVAGQGRTVTTSRGSMGPVFGAVLALPTDRPDAGGTMSYREERARVTGVSVVDRAIAASWAAGPAVLGASVGTRDATDEHAQFGSVGATIRVGRTVAVQAMAGSYPSSRVLGTLGGRYASLGLVLRGAASNAASSAGEEQVAVHGAPPVPAGATRLVLRAPDARRVELAGDWNRWAATPATRGGDGRWYVDVRLPRGEYRYAFKVDGERWAVPDGVVAVDDGFGGRSALLTVP
jgi:hypothetical protein